MTLFIKDNTSNLACKYGYSNNIAVTSNYR